MTSLRASCCWVNRRHTGTPPTPRQGHALTILAGTVYAFGGSYWDEDEAKTVYFSSLHTLLTSDADLVWTEQPQQGSVPTPRDSHAIFSLDGAVFVVGGKGEDDAEACLEGLSRFHVETSSWSPVSTAGSPPSAIGFTASLIRREVYTFGGFCAGVATNDVHMLFLDNMSWTKLKPSGIPPAPRCDHGAAVVGDRVFVFGGCGAESLYFNDVAVFDSNTLSWRHPRVHGRPPAPRGGFSFVAHRDKDLYLFGGTSETPDGAFTLFNDVVKLSLVAKEAAPEESKDVDLVANAAGNEGASVGARVYHKLRWKRPIHVGRSVGPLHGHAAVITKSHMYIVGGQNADGETNRVLTLRLLSPSQRVPILEELMQQYDSTHALAKPPELLFDLEVPPFQKPAILEPQIPASSISRAAADVRSLKSRAKDAQTKAPEDMNKAVESLVNVLDEFEKQKVDFLCEREMFLRERAAYKQQYQDQQNELSLLIQRHKEQMELWIKEQTEIYVAQQKRDEDKRNQVNRQQQEVTQEKVQLEQSKMGMVHLIQGFR